MIWNVTQNRVISVSPCYAVSFRTRFRGMIGRCFKGFDAMVFEHCSAVHTCFMRINLDIVFLNRENKICGLFPAVEPWRLRIAAKGGQTVIEMPEGAIARYNLKFDEVLDLSCAAQRISESCVNPSIIHIEPVMPYRRKTS